MIKIIISLCFIASLLLANGKKEHKHLPYETTVSLLQTIHSDAIVLGKGKKHVYVFIDPLCPHSRKFMKMISKNPKMLSKYQYHLFLYTIPRLKSTEAIYAVYISQNPIQTLLEMMLEEKIVKRKGNAISKAKVKRITLVAKEIDVYKRPFIFIIK